MLLSWRGARRVSSAMALSWGVGAEERGVSPPPPPLVSGHLSLCQSGTRVVEKGDPSVEDDDPSRMGIPVWGIGRRVTGKACTAHSTVRVEREREEEEVPSGWVWPLRHRFFSAFWCGKRCEAILLVDPSLSSPVGGSCGGVFLPFPLVPRWGVPRRFRTAH